MRLLVQSIRNRRNPSGLHRPPSVHRVRRGCIGCARDAQTQRYPMSPWTYASWSARVASVLRPPSRALLVRAASTARARSDAAVRTNGTRHLHIRRSIEAPVAPKFRACEPSDSTSQRLTTDKVLHPRQHRARASAESLRSLDALKSSARTAGRLAIASQPTFQVPRSQRQPAHRDLPNAAKLGWRNIESSDKHRRPACPADP